MQYTDQAPIDPLTFDVYPDGTSSRQYYEDDGISFDYQHGVSLLQKITVSEQDHNVGVEVSAREGSYTPPARSLVIKIHGERTLPRQVTVAGRELAGQAQSKSSSTATEGWAYDEDASVVSIRVARPRHGAKSAG